MSVPTAVWVAIGVAFVALVVMADFLSERGKRSGVIVCGALLLVIAGVALVLYALTTLVDEPRVTDWNALYERVSELED